MISTPLAGVGRNLPYLMKLRRPLAFGTLGPLAESQVNQIVETGPIVRKSFQKQLFARGKISVNLLLAINDVSRSF